MTRKAGALAVAGVLAVLVTGCTSGGVTPAATPGTATSGTPTGGPVTPVPPPTPGSTTSTVANPKESTKPAVDINKPSSTGKVTATVVNIKAIQVKARIPGETSGPGLAVTVKVVNGSKDRLNASQVLVTLYDSTKAPGGEMIGPPAKHMKGVLAPGGSATGVWVFTVPVKRRSPVTIDVVLPTESPVLRFTGDAPRR